MTVRDQVERALHDAVATQDWDTAERLGEELDALDQSRPLVPLVSAALWYAQAGLQVFPLQGLTKVPHPGTRGVKEATTDPDTIRAWWSTHPDANIGIATGHLVDVVDFDGLEGHEAWSQAFGDKPWEDVVGRILATVSTPRPGGLHVYVKATGQGNAAGLFSHVDYRGRGGYVLAPPSRLDDRDGQHPGRYSFLRRLNPQDLL